MSSSARYVGRFAPSPTGPLHAGSLAAALASYLDAKAHQGHWLLRIEDIDPPREVEGASTLIIKQLLGHGLQPDRPISWQHQHVDHYAHALAQLFNAGLAYRCSCSRKDLQLRREHYGVPPAAGEELAYDGFCRDKAIASDKAHAWRLDTRTSTIDWHERLNNQWQSESVEQQCGDFVLRRRDLLWSYQLAVVVDDAAAGVTDVVRGDDLSSNTARQCLLQEKLSLPRPRYLHIPVVRNASGQKLSKQTQAEAVPLPDNDGQRLRHLNDALRHLGIEAVPAETMDAFWPEAISRWAKRHPPAPE